MEQKNIIWKYLLTFFFIFGVVIMIRLFYDISHHKHMLDEKVGLLAKDIEKRFNRSEQNLIDKYHMLAKHLMNSDNIYRCMKEYKREDLYSSLKKDYDQFKLQDPNLQVMHFFDTNNVTILRVHKPNSYGDNLTEKRPIVAYANRSVKRQTAFEVGKNGIVYRITSPFVYNGNHTGVLEFGIKPQYFVDALRGDFEINSVILVKTDALKTLLAKRKYPSIDEFSVITKSRFLDKIAPKLDLSKSKQVIKLNGNSYIVLNDLNLKNYQGEIVSKIIIIKDITGFVEQNRHSLILINVLTFIIFVIVLILIYIVLKKYSREIKIQTKTIMHLNKKSKTLHTKANTDDLTKIYNKRFFDNYLIGLINQKREGSVIFFDIDHFKKINDTHGHLAGDKILEHLCFTIKKFLREDDVFVRWGGEEFIIFIEGLSCEVACIKAEEIRVLVESTEFYNSIPVTISLGVTDLDDDDTKESLLERADKNLYKAKLGGRNIVVC